jgi:ABC-type uncharacterized transport system, ATPase component
MLELKNITKYYGDFKAVDNLSFIVKPGEIFGFLGVNGAGKTTTFRMIMNLLEPNKGTVTLNNKKIDYDVTDQIGFLTEERSLLTKLTVKEQALFYGTLKNMSKKAILDNLENLLNKFGISEYKDKKIKELSKGNQQKIQFIMAVINKPKLLILDEPFSGLDPFNIELFKTEMVEMASSGSMIIFSSHRMEHVELFCKKLAIILKGKVVLSGYLKDIKESFRKKNIFIKGSVTKEDLLKIKGVNEVIEKSDEFEVKIDNMEASSKVFEKIKNKKNITKFVVEEPSLNEIFIAKVGESYEEK